MILECSPNFLRCMKLKRNLLYNLQLKKLTTTSIIIILIVTNQMHLCISIISHILVHLFSFFLLSTYERKWHGVCRDCIFHAQIQAIFEQCVTRSEAKGTFHSSISCKINRALITHNRIIYEMIFDSSWNQEFHRIFIISFIKF